MEALANLGIDWKLLLAQAINFLVLLFILKRYAYRPMLEFLEKRTERIEQGLRDAEAAQAKLGEMEKKEQAVLVQARKEARAILTQAEASAKSRDTRMLAEANAQAERFLAEARTQILEDKEKLLTDAKQEIAEVVSLAVEKIVRIKVDPEKDKELIERVLSK